MRYAKLSCTEFYSCYLQQCHSIDLFSYRTPGHGQKGHMYKVCPSFCSKVFLDMALQFFLELNKLLGAQMVLCMTEAEFLKIMGKIGHTQVSLNVQESSVFFSQFFIFLSIWSIILVCLNNLVNQFLVCPSNSFPRNGLLGFSDFGTMVDNSNIEKLTEPFFPGKFIFGPSLGKSVQNGSKIGFLGFFEKFCYVSSQCAPSPLEHPTKFSKRGNLTRPQLLHGGLLGKRE